MDLTFRTLVVFPLWCVGAALVVIGASINILAHKLGGAPICRPGEYIVDALGGDLN